MEDYLKALETVTKALRLMEAHHYPPSPENLMVWYAYAADVNSECRARLDQLTEKRKNLTEREVKDCVCKVLLMLADCPEFFNNLIKAHTSLDAVLGSLSEVEGETTEFGRILNHSAEKLKKASDISAAREVVAKILQETDRMAAHQNHLAEKLRDTTREVQRLQTSLAEARHLANTDTLTGLYNLRYLEGRLPLLMRKAAEEDTSLCTLMIEINNFKNIIDELGPQSADKILRLVANIIKKAVRDDDLAVRYGGREFMLVLNRTPLENAVLLGKRICEDISSRNLSQRGSDQILGRITAAVGIARHKPGESVIRLLQRSDMALSDGKKSGKDRVAVCKET
ncbi:MAG: hypothetical protein A3G18_06390 [Rhodospirillales bacterium RIFCSPLOWO2_12_FULL_58_28]|nr:MAG: hypothetical protein A3H92_03645 [Rhodospirillales bacterium RIFCSPLOWO2_02_FULL_58_16]OHC79545.1 MAG: hypothetical protein A3G18_06390 [Rhodospirillales bacterium RIFCSPLOWO2_12_FULL_58_28]